MSVLELHSKDRKPVRDKANISNPKVNRGCAQLTANRSSADCVQISFEPSIPYIPLGVYHIGGFNAMITIRKDMDIISYVYDKMSYLVFIKFYVDHEKR